MKPIVIFLLITSNSLVMENIMAKYLLVYLGKTKEGGKFLRNCEIYLQNRNISYTSEIFGVPRIGQSRNATVSDIGGIIRPGYCRTHHP